MPRFGTIVDAGDNPEGMNTEDVSVISGLAHFQASMEEYLTDSPSPAPAPASDLLVDFRSS